MSLCHAERSQSAHPTLPAQGTAVLRAIAGMGWISPSDPKPNSCSHLTRSLIAPKPRLVLSIANNHPMRNWEILFFNSSGANKIFIRWFEGFSISFSAWRELLVSRVWFLGGPALSVGLQKMDDEILAVAVWGGYTDCCFASPEQEAESS